MEEKIISIAKIVHEAYAMRNAYLFNPIHSASQRRVYEQQHSHDLVEWEEGGHTYTAQYQVICTCTAVYAKGVYTKDSKKTNLTAIKNSLKRLNDIYHVLEEI